MRKSSMQLNWSHMIYLGLTGKGFFWVFFNNLTINKIEGQDNGTEVPN
jgi:hypothetical protein